MLAPNANRILQTIMACKVLRLLRSGALKHGNDVFRSTVPSNPSQIPNLVFIPSEALYLQDQRPPRLEIGRPELVHSDSDIESRRR